MVIDDTELPVYICPKCGKRYIELFHHSMEVEYKNGNYYPVGDLNYNMFFE